MDTSTLIICQKSVDAPPGTSPFIISEIVQQFEEDESDELYERLLNLSVNHDYDVPVYTLIGNNMWHENHLLVFLYQYLADQVTPDVERILCVGVSGRYLDIVRDLADNEDLAIEITDSKQDSVSTRSTAARSLVWVVLSLFDAVLSVLLRPFFSPTESDILVKLPVFRPGTFRPIKKRLDVSYDTTFTLLTISYFRHVGKIISDSNPVVPIRCFDTVPGMVREYTFLTSLAYDLLISHTLETDVVEAIEAETGVRLETTVSHLVQQSVWSNFNTYLYHGAACRAFDRNEYSTVLITSSGASGNALALPANKHGVNTYVLPHSIRTPPIGVNRSFYRGVFTEGKIASCAVTEERTEFIPVGLPKHLDINARRSSLTTDRKGSKTLLIGTQGFSDDLQREFIGEVVPAVLTETSWNIVIKTHPRESPKFYRQALTEIGIDIEDSDRIRVTGSDLYEWIARSELLLTINSNVGIESVILGTAAASYNVWSPNLRDPLYAKYGSVPSLRDLSALVDLLESDMDAERASQQTLLDGPFMIRGNSLDRVTSRIQQRLSVSNPTDSSESAT